MKHLDDRVRHGDIKRAGCKMEYKGYVASVEFDDSADVLHGRVVNSGPYPIATFEATETRELRREFERSVDTYLKWCEEDGVEPKKPFSGKLNVRLGSELHAAVATAAKVERTSINSWIMGVLREAIATSSDSPERGVQPQVKQSDAS
ncbi:MAG: type II toxin-antitoxin system HicB family antitoxin [Gammaproteobacteria bacterium]|nr:type II toxin-antitoxin system HicB family antitoxin [Gammaproteobacteria bacterium]